MSWEAWYTLGVLAMVFAGLVANKAPDALLLGAVVALTLAGVVTPEEAFVGFSNTGMLTVAALFVVAAGLRETGALGKIGTGLFGRSRTERGALLRMAATVPVLSAFLNNTPIVSMLMPVTVDWCRKHKVSPSRLLLPLSYLCILGGTCTLIGTSTNLVVNGLLGEAVRNNPSLGEALRPIGLFELGWVGIPYAMVGISYLLLFGYRLLPKREGVIERLSNSAREYLVNLQVDPACNLVGQTVEEAGLRHLPGLFLIEILREGEALSPVPPDQVLRASDTLTFTGVVGTIVDLEKIAGLVPVADDGYEARVVEQRGRELCEAVISGSSPAVGKTVRDADFRALYNAAIVAVHRGGERLIGRVGDIVLRPGDTLLLQAGPHFTRANRNSRDFLLVSGVEDSRPLRSDKAILSLAILGLLVSLMASGAVSVVTAAFFAAGLMIITGCVSASVARRSVDWQTLVTIAAAFGLGKAMVASGVVSVAAELVVSHIGQLGPYAVLAAVYVMTSLFTETITNNAAAALVFPFAVAIAQKIGVSPRPFIMAVTFAASASFMTPLGYQTNLMVFGPGGYKVTDFFKAGFPLTVCLLICATILIPLVWPF